MDKTRKGVILFITLSVIVAMMALVGVIFTYLEKSKEGALHTAALIQADILFRDSKSVIVQLLKQAQKDKEAKKSILTLLYTAPITLQAQESQSYATLTCQPLDAGVNINWLAMQEDEKNQKLQEMAQTVFDLLAEKYEIKNSNLLLSKIIENINGTREIRQKKGILRISQLEEIVRDYRFESDDSGEILIPWSNYFSFELQSTNINSAYISSELIAMLFGMDLATVQESWVPGDDLRQFLENNGGDVLQYDSKIFTDKSDENMQCRVLYSQQVESYAFAFKYLEGRATEFDFFGKQ